MLKKVYKGWGNLFILSFIYVFGVEQIFTNGMYKSVEHRVVVSESRERISIAGFAILREKKEWDL